MINPIERDVDCGPDVGKEEDGISEMGTDMCEGFVRTSSTCWQASVVIVCGDVAEDLD